MAENVLQGEAQGIVKQLAEFIDREDKSLPSSKRAFNILEFIDKCNIRFVRANDPRLDPVLEQKTLDRLVIIIREFVKGVKHPKNVASILLASNFSEELAHKIMNGGK